MACWESLSARASWDVSDCLIGTMGWHDLHLPTLFSAPCLALKECETGLSCPSVNSPNEQAEVQKG